MSPQDHIDLRAVRGELGLSQARFADLLGVSLRAVQSCEQGWRRPGPAVEKGAILLLMAGRNGREFGRRRCWQEMSCPGPERKECLAYQSRQGHLCWLLTGNTCQGLTLRSWPAKRSACLSCPFFRELLPDGLPLISDA